MVDNLNAKKPKIEAPLRIPSPYASRPFVALVDLSEGGACPLTRATAAATAARELGIERLYVKSETSELGWTLKQYELSISRVYAAVAAANPKLDCVVLIPKAPKDQDLAFRAVAGAPELDSYFGSEEAAEALNAERASINLGAVKSFHNVLRVVPDRKAAMPDTKSSLGTGEMGVEVPVSVFSQQKVCVGGTFDLLHTGHKILLTVAALTVSERGLLVVGVTGEALLKQKALADLIQPESFRAAAVTTFLRALRPNIPGLVTAGLRVEVSMLKDPAGPAATDSELTSIVASRETSGGCEACNAKRRANGLGSMSVVLTECFPAALDNDNDPNVHGACGRGGGLKKLSSSALREASMATRTKEEGEEEGAKAASSHRLGREWCRRTDPLELPYVVGITGGVATGKSLLAARVGHLAGEELGSSAVAVLDADTYGHRAYEPGSACCEAVLLEFGETVRDVATGGIHRPSLASLVFDPTHGSSRLEALNTLVWPEIYRLLVIDLRALRQRKVNVAVVEAAVLVEAGWHDTLCDEIWCVLAHPDVQLKRLMARNSLDENAARSRLSADSSAARRVQHCDVLIDNSADDCAVNVGLAADVDIVTRDSVAAGSDGGEGVFSGALDPVLRPLIAQAQFRATDASLTLQAASPADCPLACRWRSLCRSILLLPTPASKYPAVSPAATIAPASTSTSVAHRALDGGDDESRRRATEKVDALASHWWRRIRDRYASPQRHYHGLSHITAMFELLDFVALNQGASASSSETATTTTTTLAVPSIVNPYALSLAIFFHDAVYDAKAHGGANECESAALFTEFASAAAQVAESPAAWLLVSDRGSGSAAVPAGAESVKKVAAWIERTANHLGGPSPSANDDEGLFLDLDLAVLGAPQPAYARYAEQIRFEYHAYGDAEYRTGRAKVLRSFLEAPVLFFTPLFRDALEKAARQNITDEVTRLEA